MKLLLVDDEFYIIEYLKHLVDWKEMGFSKIFSTTDSLDAEEILSKEEIDLLITDISMPEVTGIDIAKYIYDHQIKTSVVLLSGHSEFDYAQQAIRFGVREYLLKPITKEGLQDSVRKILPQLVRQSKPITADDWWELILTDLGNPDSLLAGKNLNMGFRFFRCKASNYSQMTEGKRIILQDNQEVVGIILEKTDLVDISLPILYSDVVYPHHISVVEVFYSFFYGLSVESINQRLERQQYFRALRSGQLPSKMLKNCLHDFDEVERIVACVKLSDYLYESEAINIDNTRIFRLDKKEVREEVIEDVEDYMRNQGKVQKNKEIVQRANQYIKEHLEDDLSLEVLSALVFLNTTYFSTLYKQEMGINVSNFILETRMEKAVQLLKETQLKIYDISLMVGYSNSEYFVKLFKNKFGITPNQYRKQHGLDGM